MRICDLQTGLIRISRATKRLGRRWEDTQEHWKDGNCASFERHHLQSISPQATLLIAAVHRLAGVLEAAERELSDEEVDTR